MLTISQAQIAAFTETVDAAFRKRLAARLGERRPDLTEPDAHELARYTIALGERFSIISATELMRFADLVTRLGPGFEWREDCARIVRLLSLEGPGWQRINRVRMLLDGVDPEVREVEFAREQGADLG